MHDVKSRSLIDTIYQNLKNDILQEKLAKGEKLSENTLAQEFHCSRTPVRESLKRLEQDGFIVIVPHSGSYVKDSTKNEYQQLTEVRAYLEALAIRLDCHNRVSAQQLEELLDEMDTIGESGTIDIQLFNTLHYRFHYNLVHLANNQLLDQMWGRLNLNESVLMSYQGLSKAGIKKTQTEHRRLIQAIKNGNAKDGEKCMLLHLWRKREQFRAEAQKG
ncbi:transcriptional regulator [Sphaerochaeta pleomorpha str. Grapes]|uniref:Transcriptional regulator n=1 Tax=Sphaerochaeta pleomorpha (strain ATCC BAA-1885 / DSM 22778 / Grapes) TaxID=158190 RepID=G8QR85_SPHPG|nr:GntR family transcriptional regulator [Sphaerochaeta pleomorpha]AEV31020.1 transcriptional regulator [Sphaerochaeta pleomorpha str. Grapes]